MAREWHDRHAVNQMEDEEKQRFYRSIVADKKPYFMRYIYPSLMKEYREYLKKSNGAALREFRMTIDELRSLPYYELTDRQKEFLHYYDLGVPVGMGDCVLNRICRRIEDEFDGFVGKTAATADFDQTIYKTGADYTKHNYYAVRKLYEEYIRRKREYTIYNRINDVDNDDVYSDINSLSEVFRRECLNLCSNDEELINIIVDIWYSRKTTNALLWASFPEQLCNVLLAGNGYTMHVPVKDPDGKIIYKGNRYTVLTKELEGSNEHYPERTGMDKEGNGRE